MGWLHRMALINIHCFKNEVELEMFGFAPEDKLDTKETRHTFQF